MLGGHDEVAFVLAILVVEDHDHAPGAQLGEQLIDAAQACHALVVFPGTGRQRVDVRHMKPI